MAVGETQALLEDLQMKFIGPCNKTLQACGDVKSLAVGLPLWLMDTK